MKNFQAFDNMEMMTQRTMTPEGFLVAPANLARTGIQMYLAKEFGDELTSKGVPPTKIVRLHRPAEEVFNPESMASFDGKPVIMEPHTKVSAENWRNLAVGDVHGINRNGEMLAADHVVIRDKDAIDAINDGKKFLSNGYTFDLDLTPGVTAGGEAYDGIQRNIRGNHVAIVSSPRGGSACRIADSANEVQGEQHMKKLVVSGAVIEVNDSDATVVEKLMADLDAAQKKQPSVTLTVGNVSKTITGDAAILAEFTARDEKIKELEGKQVTPEQINSLVEARVKTIGDAAKFVANFDAKGKTEVQIHREVLTAVTGKDATTKAVVDAILAGKTIGDADEKSLSTAFAAVVAAGVKEPVKESVTTSAADAALATALVGDGKNAQATKLVGRDAFIQRQKEAWKPKQ